MLCGAWADEKYIKSGEDFINALKKGTNTIYVEDISFEDETAITGSWGYFTLNVDNCEIKDYASYMAPAIYIDNDANYTSTKNSIEE